MRVSLRRLQVIPSWLARVSQGGGQASRMRIVVTGATGNVGTACCAPSRATSAWTEIVGLARRLPRLAEPAHALGAAPTSSRTRSSRSSPAPTPSSTSPG